MEELYGDPKSDHAPRSEPEVKKGSSAKDGVPERLGCGTIQEEVSQIFCVYSLIKLQCVPVTGGYLCDNTSRQQSYLHRC